MIATAATLALSLALADAAPPSHPDVVFEVAPELGTTDVNGQSGLATGLHAAGLVTVKGSLSLGLSLNGYALPFTHVVLLCPAGVPCVGPDGFYAVRAGPAVRVTRELRGLSALVQVSPQYELQLTHYPKVPSGPPAWQTSSHFAVEIDIGADAWIWSQIGVGPRLCFSGGADAFSVGLGVAFSIRAP